MDLQSQHVHLGRLYSFYVVLRSLDRSIPSDSEDVFDALRLWFAFVHLKEYLGDFLSMRVVYPGIHEQLDFVQHVLLQRIRPHALSLVEAFGFTDWELDSSLGCEDGKVYERLLEKAKQEPLNIELSDKEMAERLKPILSGDILLQALQKRNTSKL
jgi:acyl-CoA oxidase